MRKNPYELICGKMPSLKHICVWDYKVKVRPFILFMRKLDSKTIFGFFIGYYISSRGSRFYYPTHSTKVIKSDRAMYFGG